MRKLTAPILATSAVVGVMALVVPTVAMATTLNRQIALKPQAAFQTATGSAQYQTQPGQREFQVELRHLSSLAGRSVLVRVNGANVGSATVSSTGHAELTRNTELRQSVPKIGHGSTVAVLTRTGRLIASGTF